MTDITAGLIMLSEQEEEGEEEYLKRHPSVNLFELCCAVPRCDTNHQKLVLWSLLGEKEKERVMIAIIAIFCLFILEELSLEGIVDHPGAIKGKKFKQAWLLFFHTISHITIQLNHWASLEFFFLFSGNEYVTNLPLQMLIYFNVFFSPLWFITSIVMLEAKVT